MDGFSLIMLYSSMLDCLVALKDECTYCKPADNIWKNTEVLKVQLKNMVVLCPVRLLQKVHGKTEWKDVVAKKILKSIRSFFIIHIFCELLEDLICTDFRFLSVLPELRAVPAEPLVLWAVWPAALHDAALTSSWAQHRLWPDSLGVFPGIILIVVHLVWVTYT